MKKKIKISIRTSKSCYMVDEKIEVFIEILNLNANPLRLNFNSTQYYDFIILKGNEEIWRWSTNKIFAMTINSMIIKPHGKREFTETLNVQLPPDKYKLIGIINSKPHYEASCIFEVKAYS